MVLPADVVDYIFSFLREDLATLKSCTQAHPLLSEPAERHLYHRMTLDIKNGCDSDITQLSSLLERNPRIRKYFRSLAINISKESEYLFSAQTAVFKAMASILSSLPGLNKVTLALSNLSTNEDLSWFKTHEIFRSTFVNVLKRSSVTEFHLESIFAFPLSVLNTCQNIKTLSLSNCREFNQSELTSPSHHLESLSIWSSDSPNLFDWATNRIGRLTSLKLRPQDIESSNLPRLLEACATSLTSLELDMHYLGQSEYIQDSHSELFPDSDSNSVLFPFTLSTLSNLQHLTIRTVINACHEEYGFGEEMDYCDFVLYSAIPAIVRLIELSAPSLRQVVLKVLCWDFSDINSLAEVDWYPLILLGDSPTCPHIDLCISIQENEVCRGISPEDITNTVAQCPGLMRLVNLGVFSIKPDVRPG